MEDGSMVDQAVISRRQRRLLQYLPILRILKMQESMYRLLYYYESRLSEEYHFNSYALCQWKIREFTKAGTHIYGHFVIEKI
jgi:hypothetical protein